MKKQLIVSAVLIFAIAMTILFLTAIKQIDVSDKLISETDAFIEAQETHMLAATYKPVNFQDLKTFSLKEKQTKSTNVQTMENKEEGEENVLYEFYDVDIASDSYSEYYDFSDNNNAYLEEMITPEEFINAGIIFWNGWKFTYYSEQVLPGGGLHIPGRWSDGQFVRDENGYLCVACNDIEYGSYVDTPFGGAIVYDLIGDGVTGVIDIYVSW